MCVQVGTAMTFGEFIESEKIRLKLRSNRAFATKAGVSPQLINDIVNGKSRDLDIGSLSKISDLTGVTLVSLLKLAFPDVVHVDLDIEARLAAERIGQLPPEAKAIALGYINAAHAQSSDE